MNTYEIMVIITSALNEKDAQTHIQDEVLKTVKEYGGKVTFEDFWGERGFAYKIKGMKWGYYFVAQFELAADKVQELRKDLKIDNKIVRSILVTVDPKAPAPRTHAELKKEWEAQEKEKKIAEAESTKPTSTVPAKAAQSDDNTESDEGEKDEEKKEEPKKKPNKDAIDKKLDDILEDSSLDL